MPHCNFELEQCVEDCQLVALSHLEPHKILKAAIRVHTEFRQRLSLSNSAIDARKTSRLGPAVLRLPS